MSDNPTETDLVCAVDLGGTNLRAANIDREGRIHERVRTSTPKSDSAEDVVSAITAAVRECEAQSLRRGAHVQAVTLLNRGRAAIHTIELTTVNRHRADMPLHRLARDNRGRYQAVSLTARP